MSNWRLFITENSQVGNVGNSVSTKYSFSDGELTLFWRGRKVLTQPAKIGDAYLIVCNGDTPKISPLALPRGREEKVMWLCGFNKCCRTLSYEKYEEILEKNREMHPWWGYTEYTRSGNGWAVTLCNQSDIRCSWK